MLVLTRHVHQSIVIGHDVVVTVLEVRGDQVRLGITAPKDVQVHREEVFIALTAANREAATSAGELEVLNGLQVEALPPPGPAPAGTAPAGTAPAGTAPAGTAPAGTDGPSGATGDAMPAQAGRGAVQGSGRGPGGTARRAGPLPATEASPGAR